MLTIDELQNMLDDLRIKEEKLYDVYTEGGSNYAKGFLTGQIHLLTHLIEDMNNRGVLK